MLKTTNYGMYRHKCTCHAPTAAQLEELVEAAEVHVIFCESHMSDKKQEPCSLRVALQPFREEK